MRENCSFVKRIYFICILLKACHINIQVITGDMTRVTEEIIKTATKAITAEEGAGTEEEVIEDKLKSNSSTMNNDIEF